MDDLNLTCLPSFDPFEVSSPILSDFELLELLWKKGPVQKPSSTGQFQVSPASSALQLGNEAVPFIDENEMSMWLQYPIEETTDTCTRTGTGTTLVEKLLIEPIVPAHEEQMDSSQMARTKRKLKHKAGSRGDTNGAESGTGDKLSSRRAHKAKVHNLSERKRRERINEKLKTLQELIPRCDKSDKASMLGQAIGYVKSLQKQVQMMSMGCSMRPLMFPSAPPMGMNFGLGMNMNMKMGMGMPPFGPVMPCAQYNSPMMPMQHKQDVAPSSMFMFPHGQNPCHCPFVLPRQAQVLTTQSRSQDKSDKGKQS